MIELNDKQSTLDYVALTSVALERLAKNKPVRRSLPNDGRLRIDRQLPFLVVYRVPKSFDGGTGDLVTSEAAYLIAPSDEEHHGSIEALCQRLAGLLNEHFGTYLIVEIWSESKLREGQARLQPAFEIVTSERDSLPGTIEAFSAALSEITIAGHQSHVTVRETSSVAPVDFPAIELQSQSVIKSTVGVVLGLAVRPIYQDAKSKVLFPLVLRSLRAQVARALRKTISHFNGNHVLDNQTNSAFPHFESYGPRAMAKTARMVDQQLSEVSEAFDFILQVTPTNTEDAWRAFRESEFKVEPVLQYRSLPYDPSLLKRNLFRIEIEAVEDPTLSWLFLRKQSELDQQLSALRQLDTSDFLYSSLQLYGKPTVALVDLAESILMVQSEPCLSSQRGDCASLEDVLRQAREEIDYYHHRLSEFNGSVEVSEEIASGFLVSQDRLIVSSALQVSKRRVMPLLHHEIGTHLLTYFNGRCQPLRQLYAGLDGYEGLQEGLAVMAEYLTGGLTRNRLRTLAARVIAADSMIRGATFIDTFQRLHEQHHFSARRSFVTTLRVFRGGGLTKDIIYLRGLYELLEYLAAGHELEPLYVGKIAMHHLPAIQELRRRGIVHAPGVLPRFWKDTKVKERLESCRQLSVNDLLEHST